MPRDGHEPKERDSGAPLVGIAPATRSAVMHSAWGGLSGQRASARTSRPGLLVPEFPAWTSRLYVSARASRFGRIGLDVSGRASRPGRLRLAVSARTPFGLPPRESARLRSSGA